jgi:hypothetical protein
MNTGNKLTQRILFNGTFFLISAFLPARIFGQAISDKNWINHPSIVEVRKICREIDNSISIDSLQKQTLRDTGETHISETIGYLNRKDHKIRKVQMQYSEDLCMYGYHWEVNTYYDKGTNKKDGSVRFIYALFETDEGRKAEYRKYFDKKGLPIWLNKKVIQSNDKEIPDDIPPTYILENNPSSFFK